MHEPCSILSYVAHDHSWSSFIMSYAGSCKRQIALSSYRKMEPEHFLHPNQHVLMTSLKECTKLKDLERGMSIHAQFARTQMHEGKLLVHNVLVDMYAKCGSLTKAQEVFEGIPNRDVVSWNTMISGFAAHGRDEEALRYFGNMKIDGSIPDAITFVCILKVCGRIGAKGTADEIHIEVVGKGLLENPAIACALLEMHVKNGSLIKAHEVFDKLPSRNTAVWTSLISGYVENGLGERALECFDSMTLEGIYTDSITCMCILKACSNIADSGRGLEIHNVIEKRGILLNETGVANSLLNMYVKCFPLAVAQSVFHRLPVQDVISWNILIMAYAQNSNMEEILNCFNKMQINGILPSSVTYTCILDACGSTGDLVKGCMMHEEIERMSLLERNTTIGIALVDMYGKCGWLTRALEIFNRLPVHNTLAWNVLIARYAENGQGKESIECLRKMQLEGVCPDEVTFLHIVKVCGRIGAIEEGCEIHDGIERIGMLRHNLYIGTALVDMYIKCGCMHKACEVFSKLSIRNVISWTTLIAGYTGSGHHEEALKCFEQMQQENVSPNSVTLTCSLNSCNSLGATQAYESIFSKCTKQSLLGVDLYFGNSMVNMYGKRGLLFEAREVFDKLPMHDVASWNALIAGYAVHGDSEEVQDCLQQMHLEGISPDALTFISALKVCGSVGAVSMAHKIHSEIERKGLLRSDIVLGSALVDTYARCGMIAKAQDVFNKLTARNIVTWNVLIAGYGLQGDMGRVMCIFSQMAKDGIKPDEVTFVLILAACNHAGLFDMGQTYFTAMSKNHGIVPVLEHHSCMVDLLGRTGQLDEAIARINDMPVNPNIVVWHALLSACNTWGNVRVGRKAFQNVLQLDIKDAASYVFMSKICANSCELS